MGGVFITFCTTLWVSEFPIDMVMWQGSAKGLLWMSRSQKDFVMGKWLHRNIEFTVSLYDK